MLEFANGMFLNAHSLAEAAVPVFQDNQPTPFLAQVSGCRPVLAHQAATSTILRRMIRKRLAFRECVLRDFSWLVSFHHLFEYLFLCQ